MTYDICRCSISWESLGSFQRGKGTPWIYARNYSKSLICPFRWLSLANFLLKNLLSHSMVPCFMNAPCLKCLASGSQECGGLVDRHNEGCHFDLIRFHTQSSRSAGSNWNRCCQQDLWVRPSVKHVRYAVMRFIQKFTIEFIHVRVTFKTGGWLTPILFESLEFRRFDSATFWMERHTWQRHPRHVFLSLALDATCRIGAVGLEEAGGLKSWLTQPWIFQAFFSLRKLGESWGGVFLQLCLRGWRPGALRGGIVGIVWFCFESYVKNAWRRELQQLNIEVSGVGECDDVVSFLVLGQHTKLCQSPGSLELQPRYWKGEDIDPSEKSSL